MNPNRIYAVRIETAPLHSGVFLTETVRVWAADVGQAQDAAVGIIEARGNYCWRHVLTATRLEA